ncbi:MAG: hypothetical protein EBX36_02360 [Planctomycetia bacterium]|nr:hypothetical protein [Planctomycetia bacterium]
MRARRSWSPCRRWRRHWRAADRTGSPRWPSTPTAIRCSPRPPPSASTPVACRCCDRSTTRRPARSGRRPAATRRSCCRWCGRSGPMRSTRRRCTACRTPSMPGGTPRCGRWWRSSSPRSRRRGRPPRRDRRTGSR